jgi:chromosome condensin MukBEF ATPase and DNA-binding subunit MukB
MTSDSLPSTLAGCEAEHRQLCKKLKKMEKDAVNLRKMNNMPVSVCVYNRVTEPGPRPSVISK